MAEITLQVFESSDPKVGYISWTPVPLTIINHNQRNESIRLTNQSAAGSITQVVFFENLGDAPLDEMTVDLNGNLEVTVFVAGNFQPDTKHNGASEHTKDVEVKAAFESDPGTEVAKLPLMVRVRKNANELSDQARRDFLTAIAQLNGIQQAAGGPGPGNGIYTSDFVKMHVAGATDSEHGDSHFLPWHRLYLLDLERQMQEINPAVTLPYWRFDEPAPSLFTQDFMGEMQEIPRDISQPGGEFDPGGANTPLAVFAVDNPLSKWQIENTTGIPRTARFDPATEPANGLARTLPPLDFAVLNQSNTLLLGGGGTNPDDAEFGERIDQGGGNSVQTGFSSMEVTPHGAAHVSFNGYINDVPVAPQDPLFFLLHCNVDRLWALWQFVFDRDAKNEVKSYPYQNSGDASSWKIINASQWPWNGGNSEPAGLSPPGTRQDNFTESNQVQNFPEAVPMLDASIDPFGQRDTLRYLGFAYDDLPFVHKPPTTPLV